MLEDPLVGTYVGRYRILRLLGKGGMGRVYLAEQPEIGSRVAIKVLSDDVADSPELAERLFREARTVNVIRHEQIVNILDLDRLPNGRPFIVMEYIAGVSLRAVVDGGSAPLGGVVHVMIEVLLALDAAHRAGVVHRDLKPDNVMLTPVGRVKVLDFGIAKSVDDTRLRTRTGSVFGTPQYMAPEQVLGTAVDGRCDVYTAGIMLFELATGQRPFDGASDFALMEAQLRTPPPRASALRPAIPDALEAVIAQALSKSPEHRFQSARAMATALRQAAAALPESEWRPLGVVDASSSVSLGALPAIDSAAPTHRNATATHQANVATHREGSGEREPAGRLDRRTQTMAPAQPDGEPSRDSEPRTSANRVNEPPRDSAREGTHPPRDSENPLAVNLPRDSAGELGAHPPRVSAGELGAHPPRVSVKPLDASARGVRRGRGRSLLLALVGLLVIATIVILVARRRDVTSPIAIADDARAADSALGVPDASLVAVPDSSLVAVGGDLIATPADSGTAAADAWAGFEQARPPDARAKPADAMTADARAAAPVDARPAPPDATIAVVPPDASPARGEPPKSSWDGGKNHWADYSATRFDASAYLARAQQLAREMAPGATLAEMTVPWVYPDGHVVLGISENPSYAFHAPGTKPCIVFVAPQREYVGTNPRDVTCKRGVGMPRCTVKQILARAQAAGAPVDPVADKYYGPRNYVTWDGRWRVVVNNKSGSTVFSEDLDDNC